MVMEVMYVVKRDGSKETVSFDKVSKRLEKLLKAGNEFNRDLEIDHLSLAQKVCADIYSGVHTYELDELAAQTCAALTTDSGDYGILASRLAISNHHKRTSPSFSETIQILMDNKNKNGKNCPIVTKELYNTVMKHKVKLNQIIDYSRDYDIDYFGFKTMEKSYLLRTNGIIIERPQHMFLRVSLGIHGGDIKSAIRSYNSLSLKKAMHATPTLYNAGTVNGQLASCFLMGIDSDSIGGIYDALKDTAHISKSAGGIGIHIHNIRGRGSDIAGGAGTSNGIVPRLRVFNNTARYVDQNGKRNGSFAIYLEPWHTDIMEFLELRKNQGFEERRARDLFYALWIPDLFMKRVEKNEKWTLMCPYNCPGLSDTYGEEFDKLYEKYENEGKGEQINAQELWFKILESQAETGTPYMLFKDSSNQKSNQKNLGTIKSSNLCCEVIEYSGPDETAVCNLASISLPACVIPPVVDGQVSITTIPNCSFCKLASAWVKRWNIDTTYTSLSEPVKGKKYPIIKVGTFEGGFTEFIEAFPVLYDYEELGQITRQLTRNLNKVIDRSTYPIESARRSNTRHRPIGIGVQGLADVFMKMRIAFDSPQAKFINEKIFETIYYASLDESMQLAQKKAEKKKPIDGVKYPGAYSSFEGSPAQQGILQFDLWNQKPIEAQPNYDWTNLKKNIQKYGTVNSLLVAPMPTASTAQILGNTECFEPITSNIYVRRTLAGEFIVMNKYLQEDLVSLGVWDKQMKDSILSNNGSVSHLTHLPQIIRNTYKTVWELSQKVLIDYAADRGKFICQSQSLNLFLSEAKASVVTSMLFYAWKKGLKTGVYYLRTRPQSKAQSFTIEPVKEPVCESCSA